MTAFGKGKKTYFYFKPPCFFRFQLLLVVIFSNLPIFQFQLFLGFRAVVYDEIFQGGLTGPKKILGDRFAYVFLVPE